MKWRDDVHMVINHTDDDGIESAILDVDAKIVFAVLIVIGVLGSWLSVMLL